MGKRKRASDENAADLDPKELERRKLQKEAQVQIVRMCCESIEDQVWHALSLHTHAALCRPMPSSLLHRGFSISLRSTRGRSSRSTALRMGSQSQQGQRAAKVARKRRRAGMTHPTGAQSRKCR
jgi:hypothetical protein